MGICEAREDSPTGPRCRSGAVKRPALSGRGTQAPAASDLPRVRASLRLTRRRVHVSCFSHFALSLCTSCGPWPRADRARLLSQVAGRVGQTHFSVPGPDTPERKKQAIKTTFPPLSNFRNSPSQVFKFICLTCSLVPSETMSLTIA